MRTIMGLTVWLLAAAAPAAAQTELARQVIGGGGGNTAGANHTLRCTVGQAAVGPRASTNYAAALGFWHRPHPGLTDVASPPAPQWRLDQNHPNPFNPMTNIGYSLPSAGHVHLAVYDLRGRLVRLLVDQKMEAGAHQTLWDGRDQRGQAVASEVYLARLTTAEGALTMKMVLAR